VPKVKATKENTDVLPTVTISADQTLHRNENKVNINNLQARWNSIQGADHGLPSRDGAIRGKLLPR